MTEKYFTISEIITEAKRIYKISGGKKDDDVATKRAMREQIIRALKTNPSSEKSYWDFSAVQVRGEKNTHKFPEGVADWVLSKGLHDYFCKLSDYEKIRNIPAERKRAEQIADKRNDDERNFFRHLGNEDGSNYVRLFDEMLLAEKSAKDKPLGINAFNLSEDDINLDLSFFSKHGSAIYAHMLEKLFEKFFSPFDFATYKKDYMTLYGEKCRGVKATLSEDIFAQERYGEFSENSVGNLKSYYTEKEEGNNLLIDTIVKKVVEELTPIITSATQRK